MVTVVVVWFSGFGNPGWMEGRWEVVSGRSGRVSVCGGAFGGVCRVWWCGFL